MILVTGSGGLLGSWLCFRYSKDTLGFTHKELDITNRDDVQEILKHHHPEVVVNCAGLTNKIEINRVAYREVNANAVWELAQACNEVGAKLVHISTDCVFSGKRGKYTEDDEPDSSTAYGMSKIAGELIAWDSPHLVIRSSFIGWPDPNMRGLLAWLYTNKGKTVPGYTGVKWNGLAVTALCDYIVQLAYSRRTGIQHLYGQSLYKKEVLEIASDVFGWDVNVYPQHQPVSDMTLFSKRMVDYIPGTYHLRESLEEMRKWNKAYLLSCP